MKRVLSALTLLPVVIATIRFLPPVGTLVLAEAAALLALREYTTLATAFGARVFGGVAAAGVAATVAGVGYGATTAVLLGALLAIGVASLSVGRRGDRMLIDAAASAFPLLYLGLSLGAVQAVRTSGGAGAVLLLLGLIVASDTAQYYGGRWLGRTPLAAISPGKTVEGALFGLAAGGGVMAAAGPIAFSTLSRSPIAAAAVLGVVIAGLGIAGDLFESLLKRGAGVKDASTLIPGHGGVLDRIDSLLFAGPGFYLMLQFL
ncbi:MAG: phosphatidate cytidylyltransferase [Acidobacteria bacterium]|nr:phosphatidate cytidylyltransferase [Acidobacteriota bacterium]